MVQAGRRVSQHFDITVFDSGPGGRRAVVQAAKLRKSVLVVERNSRYGPIRRDYFGITIPSKTLRETALNLSGGRERGFYGCAYQCWD
jgi:NAD(P) transhydrogenase